jgi:hypothetical protein
MTINLKERFSRNSPPRAARLNCVNEFASRLVMDVEFYEPGSQNGNSCAGINRHEAENAKVLRERASDPLGLEAPEHLDDLAISFRSPGGPIPELVAVHQEANRKTAEIFK